MATLPLQVRPGDVISSDLMNAVLEELADLKGSAISGSQTVPNLFGSFLSDARTSILTPSRQLAMGFVLDTSGAAVDPLMQVNATRLVLNQSPGPDARVAPNTPVNLVVSGTGSIPSGGAVPTIARTETPLGVPATSFRVGETLILVGTNFSPNAALNTVTFNNRTATVASDPTDATRRLILVVPIGITGAPVTPADSPLAGVSLSITTPGGGPISTTVTVTAPSATPQPTINNFSPAGLFEGQDLTINGSNFSTTAARNQVAIDGTAAAVSTASATQLVVVVPQLPGLALNQSRVCQVRVTTLDASSTPIGTVIAGSTLTVVGA